MKNLFFSLFIAFSTLFIAAMAYFIFFPEMGTVPVSAEPSILEVGTVPTPEELPADAETGTVPVLDDLANEEFQRREEAVYMASRKAEKAESLRKDKIEDAWTDALDAIDALSEKGTVPGKSDIKRFKAAFDALDEDDKLMQINHANVVISDEASDCLAAILFDPKEPEDVLSAILFSFANKDDSLGLPVLKKVADDPSHPLSATARDILADR